MSENGTFYYQWWQSYTFSYKKGAYSIPGSTEKMGLFGTHICTMSYIGIYPPPPTRVMGQSTLVLDMGLTKFAEMMILLENVRLRPSTYVWLTVRWARQDLILQGADHNYISKPEPNTPSKYTKIIPLGVIFSVINQFNIGPCGLPCEAIGPEWSNLFSRGSVPELLRKYIATCDFPGWADSLPPVPLWIRPWTTMS